MPLSLMIDATLVPSAGAAALAFSAWMAYCVARGWYQFTRDLRARQGAAIAKSTGDRPLLPPGFETMPEERVMVRLRSPVTARKDGRLQELAVNESHMLEPWDALALVECEPEAVRCYRVGTRGVYMDRKEGPIELPEPCTTDEIASPRDKLAERVERASGLSNSALIALMKHTEARIEAARAAEAEAVRERATSPADTPFAVIHMEATRHTKRAHAERLIEHSRLLRERARELRGVADRIEARLNRGEDGGEHLTIAWRKIEHLRGDAQRLDRRANQLEADAMGRL